MISIEYTDKFRKNYEKLTNIEKTQFKNKLSIFVENPMHQSLRVHSIRGSNGLFEFSVNMSIRVIWKYRANELIALVDIGHHDILKKY